MLIEFAILFVCVIVLISYRWYKRNFSFWERYTTIPSVPGRVFSGNFLDFITFKTNFWIHLKSIYDDAQYRDEAVVGIYALQPALLIREPELIKSVLVRDFDYFRNRNATTDLHHDPIFSQMLFFNKSVSWKDTRSKLSPIFTTGKLKQMYSLIQQVGQNLEQCLLKRGDRFESDVKHLASQYTTDVISTTVFGISCNSLENPQEKMYAQTNKLAQFTLRRGFDYLLIFFAPQLTKFFKIKGLFKETEHFLRYTTQSIMQLREISGEKRNDMIDIFIKLKQEAEANGEITKEIMENLSAQMGIFLAGGYETSSTTISNMLFELAKHPEIQSRLRQEILNGFLEGKGSISYEALSDLKYLNMIVNETLRMYPVLPMLERQYRKPNGKAEHYSLKPYYDFDIPDGMVVYISTYALNYDPQYWSNPTKFDPERFSTDIKETVNDNVFLPFGNGPRNCIGARLAQLQVKNCIAHILKNHRLEVCKKTNLQAKFNIKAFMLQPEGGIYLNLIKDDLYNRSCLK